MAVHQPPRDGSPDGPDVSDRRSNALMSRTEHDHRECERLAWEELNLHVALETARETTALIQTGVCESEEIGESLTRGHRRTASIKSR